MGDGGPVRAQPQRCLKEGTQPGRQQGLCCLRGFSDAQEGPLGGEGPGRQASDTDSLAPSDSLQASLWGGPGSSGWEVGSLALWPSGHSLHSLGGATLLAPPPRAQLPSAKEGSAGQERAGRAGALAAPGPKDKCASSRPRAGLRLWARCARRVPGRRPGRGSRRMGCPQHGPRSLSSRPLRGSSQGVTSLHPHITSRVPARAASRLCEEGDALLSAPPEVPDRQCPRLPRTGGRCTGACGNVS